MISISFIREIVFAIITGYILIFIIISVYGGSIGDSMKQSAAGPYLGNIAIGCTVLLLVVNLGRILAAYVSY
jgi:hypothetical protein